MERIANIYRFHHELPFPGMPATRMPAAFHCLQDEGGLVLIDPFQLPEAEVAELEALGQPAHVLITNQNHERGALHYRRHYGARILAHGDLAGSFDFHLDSAFDHEDPLPGGLTAIHMPGAFKGETIFLHPDEDGSLIVGDAVMNLTLSRYGVAGAAMRAVGWPEGPGSMPRLLMQNETTAVDSYRRLLATPFSRILMTHGTPILADARWTLQKGLLNHRSILPSSLRRALSRMTSNVWDLLDI